MLYHVHCPLRLLQTAPPSYEARFDTSVTLPILPNRLDIQVTTKFRVCLQHRDRDRTLRTDAMGIIFRKKHRRTLQPGATEERDR